MIDVVFGPLVSSPPTWNLVFNRRAATWWVPWLALGRYQHVRAYGYVPFLHIWQFVDVGVRGFNVFNAADGPAANSIISEWIADADVIEIAPRRDSVKRLPLLGFCVPAMKRLIGARCSALRPDAFASWCLRNGGVPFEAIDGRCKD